MSAPSVTVRKGCSRTQGAELLLFFRRVRDGRSREQLRVRHSDGLGEEEDEFGVGGQRDLRIGETEDGVGGGRGEDEGDGVAKSDSAYCARGTVTSVEVERTPRIRPDLLTVSREFSTSTTRAARGMEVPSGRTMRSILMAMDAISR